MFVLGKRLQPILANIVMVSYFFTGLDTVTLAYYAMELITAVISLMTQAFGACFLRLSIWLSTSWSDKPVCLLMLDTDTLV